MRGYARLLDALGVAAGAAFALIALATTWDVGVRSLAGGTVKGLAEWVEYVLFVSTFLAAPWLLRHNGHVQVDFLVEALPERLRAATRRAGDAVGLAVCAVLLVYAVRVTLGAWQSGSLVMKTMIFPEWWLYAVIVVSMALLVLEFARRLVVGQVEPHGPQDL
ncbi:MAG TPA: TRAP transporter small permease [Ideonella sp.]|nr:TRAP transporter small permease [Ideonella sp.]